MKKCVKSDQPNSQEETTGPTNRLFNPYLPSSTWSTALCGRSKGPNFEGKHLARCATEESAPPLPRVNVTDDETILHDTERRRCCAPFVVPNLNGAAGRATCCRSSSGSQGACARCMCAVLCRTWLPKSKAELVGRGFDIGVASSSSSSLPLSTRSLGRSVGRGG